MRVIEPCAQASGLISNNLISNALDGLGSSGLIRMSSCSPRDERYLPEPLDEVNRII
jgi:hypothetical protein